MIWPQVRRRASRLGVVGVHVALTASRTSSPTTVASRSSTGSGLRRSCTRPREPVSTALQKKSVVLVPRIPLLGTARLESRQSSIQVIGSVHCVFMFGPVGPLKNAFCSSPQRPPKVIQGNASRAATGSLGIARAAGRSSRCGPRAGQRVSVARLYPRR